MAKSKYEYVRQFESATDYHLLLDSYIVVRVDGQCFHRYAKEHNFLKPNDKRCLDLMNRSALHVMRSFYPNIIMAYGQSDEYSFILRRMAQFFNRRQNKIISLITSTFTAGFIYHWNDYFSDAKNTRLIPKIAADGTKSLSLTQTMKYPPSFDGRCILYPNERTLMDYLRWRQVDCHINNLYNTTFYALTGEYTHYEHDDKSDKFNVSFPYCGPKLLPKLSTNEATQRLSHTSSGDKNEILFTDYGINYNNELQQFRKGTIITLNMEQIDRRLFMDQKSTNNFNAKKNKKQKKDKMCVEYPLIQESSDDQQQLFDLMNVDIISEEFWQKYDSLLKLL
ncbi:tRNA-histidine guanylyltransferase 1-like [Dermatophagoides farinae]|uniref:tRNA(His) guanylyltransferase n=1 Tax=Dermatophagoides farinae TaxID=6954 RepID=A0A922IF59_DERFA|nr:tRNA-histidine guanylyltransferase 1-like [Dermatophagoides farinae]